MTSTIYQDLASRGLRAPLATDLYLHEDPDPEQARHDGVRLGKIIAHASREWDSPLGLPLMDLCIDKADLLARLDISEYDADRFQFKSPFNDQTRAALARPGALCPGSLARDRALTYLRDETDLLPIGVAIGPFSLTTKLMADPITAAAMVGSEDSAEVDPNVRLLLDCLTVSERLVQDSVRRQIAAGARAILICEPTASIAYLSPRQIRAGSPIFEQLVLEPNLRLKAVLKEGNADLIFHDCGELTDAMVEAFGRVLEPMVLSLGSSRKLWEDAALVPKSVVLYGNLPTKSFYSDAAMPLEEVRRRTNELVSTMRACGHPYILGSECDVLHVPDAAATIRRKVEAMKAPENVA